MVRISVSLDSSSVWQPPPLRSMCFPSRKDFVCYTGGCIHAVHGRGVRREAYNDMPVFLKRKNKRVKNDFTRRTTGGLLGKVAPVD